MRAGDVLTIGIAGPSGAGKTALARRLVERLADRRALRLPLDAFYRDRADLAPALREVSNFDHPDSIDRPLLLDRLAGLAAGHRVTLPVYRFETHTRAAHGREVGPAGFVVADGLFALYWPELRALLRIKVFVELDPATCLARRIARDVAERGRTERSVRAQYERTVRPMCERFVRPAREHADLVLDGHAPLEESASAVLALVAGT